MSAKSSADSRYFLDRELAFVSIIAGQQREIEKAYSSVEDWRSLNQTSGGKLSNLLIDPAVNLEVKELRSLLYERESEIRKLKDELQAAVFTPDSVMGRRLINKCRTLQNENQDFGRLVTEGQIKPLQCQMIAAQKKLVAYRGEMGVLQELNIELDEENERLTQQISELTKVLRSTQEALSAVAAQDLQRQVNVSPKMRFRRQHMSSALPQGNAMPIRNQQSPYFQQSAAGLPAIQPTAQVSEVPAGGAYNNIPIAAPNLKSENMPHYSEAPLRSSYSDASFPSEAGGAPPASHHPNSRVEPQQQRWMGSTFNRDRWDSNKDSRGDGQTRTSSSSSRRDRVERHERNISESDQRSRDESRTSRDEGRQDDRYSNRECRQTTRESKKRSTTSKETPRSKKAASSSEMLARADRKQRF